MNKIDKPLARLTEEKRKTQITSIRHEKDNITTYPTNIKKIIREY